MPNNVRVINAFGKMQGWNSVTLNLLGRDVIGISEIDYDDNTDKENVYGAGNYPIGRNADGNYTAKASISLYKEEVDALDNALPAGMRLQDIAAFDIPVEWEKADGKIQRDIIRNAEFKNRGVAIKQGDGTSVTKYDLIISHIDWNV